MQGYPQLMLAGNSAARTSASGAGAPINSASDIAGTTNITSASCPTQKKKISVFQIPVQIYIQGHTNGWW
jgi:hypothetical protein